MSQSTTLPPLNKPTGKHEGYAAQAKNSLLGTPPAPSDSMASLGVQNVDDVMDGSVATHAHSKTHATQKSKPRLLQTTFRTRSASHADQDINATQFMEVAIHD